MIGHAAVDLFGHRQVERPQPRLDVGQSDVELGCCQRSGEGAVGVPEHHHHIRSKVAEDGIEAVQHFPGLFSL